jgi:hypothetical protein
MYLLKTGPPAHLRMLRVFEPLMVITGIVTPLATIPSISKLYFTHSQHASGQSLTTWSIFAAASLLAGVRIAEQKARHLCWQHDRARNEFADGEWHPDARWMDLLSSLWPGSAFFNRYKSQTTSG